MTKILAKPVHAWIPDKHAHFLWLSASCLSMLYERNWAGNANSIIITSCYWKPLNCNAGEENNGVWCHAYGKPTRFAWFDTNSTIRLQWCSVHQFNNYFTYIIKSTIIIIIVTPVIFVNIGNILFIARSSLLSLTHKYRVMHEEGSIFFEVIVSVNVKKKVNMNMCLILNDSLDRALWVYKHKRSNLIFNWQFLFTQEWQNFYSSQ